MNDMNTLNTREDKDGANSSQPNMSELLGNWIIGDFVQQDGAAPRQIVWEKCAHAPCGGYVGLLGTTDQIIFPLTSWNKGMFRKVAY